MNERKKKIGKEEVPITVDFSPIPIPNSNFFFILLFESNVDFLSHFTDTQISNQMELSEFLCVCVCVCVCVVSARHKNVFTFN